MIPGINVHQGEPNPRRQTIITATAAASFSQKGRCIVVLIDPKDKLVDVLANAQKYLDLATKSTDRGEREFYERIVALYLKIAQELEALIDG